MKKLLFLGLILAFLPLQVSAVEITPPTAPASAEKYMPENTESFGEGLWYIIKEALLVLQPEVMESVKTCIKLICTSLIISFMTGLGAAKRITDLTGVVTIGLVLMEPANKLIQIGLDTIAELSEYSKLLLPVMTTAMAAEGAVTSSAAIYAATTWFVAILTTAVSKLIIPLIYVFMAICIADQAVGEGILKDLKSFLNWLITWILKITLYAFTGFVSITGVISGSADASAIKAAKIAISGAVPIVGGIISDASETILVSVSFMKQAAGIYGLLAIVAICIVPFFKTSIQYLLLKATSSTCGMLGTEKTTSLISDFSKILGYILAMTGIVCLLLLIGTVSFMKGIR